MLPRKHRLPIKGFPLKAEVLFKGKLVMAKTAVNKPGLQRIGVSSSQKRIKNAVTRNSVKRFVLDYLGEEIDGPRTRGTDLLIIVTAPIIRLDSEIKVSLQRDLEKVRSLMKQPK